MKTRLLKSPTNYTATQKSTREKENADLIIVKSNAITAAPPLPVPPVISIDTKMDQKSTTSPGNTGKMERRSSILKEKIEEEHGLSLQTSYNQIFSDEKVRKE